jgi:hypothetical protein
MHRYSQNSPTWNLNLCCGVERNMRRFWAIVLPIIGLILFALVSYLSEQRNRERHRGTGRYYYWSSIRLDSDPLNKKTWLPRTSRCAESENDCVSWDPEFIHIDPGLVPKLLFLTALPAFLVGALIIRGLSRIGVSEVISFMACLPALLGAWFYLVGWLIDKWRLRRRTTGT